MMLLTIARYWVLYGIGWFFLCIGMETVLFLARGPEYQAWLYRHIQKDRKERAWSQVLFVWMLVWPIIFIFWVNAARKGKSLVEKIILERIAKEAEIQADNDRRMHRVIRLKQADRHAQLFWRTFSVHVADQYGKEVHPFALVRVTACDLLITHMIMETTSNRQFNITRIGETTVSFKQTSHWRIDFKAASFQEAIAFCENDTEFLDLCVADKQSQRIKWLEDKRR